MTSNSNATAQTVLVLGAGSWGATLADLLARKGLPTRLWSHTQASADRLSLERTLPSKLPGFALSEKVLVGYSLDMLIEGASTLVFALPSRHFRAAARLVRESVPKVDLTQRIVVSATKGFEAGSLKPMSVVLSEELGVRFPVALSGPSHAEEVSAGLPTTVVAAARDHDTARRIQDLFLTPRFRVYTSEDLLGVELGGALKNVIAIAVGAAIGMGFGDNTAAALVTRGLAEISRLGAAMGADPATFSGLSGLGDLVVTCGSPHSRNRRLGLALAKGIELNEALAEIGMVAEGVEMARSVKDLSRRYGVEMPISSQVAETLFEGVPVKEAVSALMLRDPKPEKHHP
jgi:glycerol-3-phosphate dehydrogenase (NAD(P)+)